MTINNTLRKYMPSMESSAPEVGALEAYEELRMAIEDLSNLNAVTTELASVLSTVDEASGIVSVLVDEDRLNNQVLDMYQQVVTSARDFLGCDVSIVSVESLVSLEARSLHISNEAGGFMAKAWDAVVALIKKVYAAIAAIGAKLNPWYKSNAAEAKKLKDEIKDGTVEVPVSPKTVAKADVVRKDLKESLGKSGKALVILTGALSTLEKGQAKNAEVLDVVEKAVNEIQVGEMGEGTRDKLRDFYASNDKPDTDKLLTVADVDRYFLGDEKEVIQILDDSGAVVKRIEKLAENGKGGAPVAVAILNAVNTNSRAVTAIAKDNAAIAKKIVSGKRKKEKKGGK